MKKNQLFLSIAVSALFLTLPYTSAMAAEESYDEDEAYYDSYDYSYDDSDYDSDITEETDYSNTTVVNIVSDDTEESDEIYFSPYTMDKKIISQMLGVTVDELEIMLADGADIYELLNNAGKLDDYRQYMADMSKSELNRLVDAGEVDVDEAGELYEKSIEQIYAVWSIDNADTTDDEISMEAYA